jgi:hypothetical protein
LPEPVSPPFRFYDNRQKYLTFVSTCNEKSKIAARAAEELARLTPTPPALRLFDAGMGDGTVLSRMIRTVHRYFPTVPLLAVAKEISLEDVRLSLEKMADRFHEHPHTVLVVTNVNYADAPKLIPADSDRAAALEWHVVRLEGTSAHEFGEQIDALGDLLAHGWATTPNPETSNPVYAVPSVLVLYRKDYEFLLDNVIPVPRKDPGSYDFVLASQPWRSRTPPAFKVKKILAPLARSLAPGGRMLTIQSWGRDPGVEVAQAIWPGDNPFPVGRGDLLRVLADELSEEAADFDLSDPSDEDAVFRFEMHTLPSEIGERIGTSTLFAAWNAVIYVNQIEDERLEAVGTDAYREATEAVLHDHGGLWFNDEAFVVSRLRIRHSSSGGAPSGRDAAH